MVKSSKSIGRRDFVKSSLAATGSAVLVKSGTAFGTQANSMLNVALLGCGGRGNSVAGDFVNNTNVQVTVLGDIFQDRLNVTERRFNEMQSAKGRSSVKQKFHGPQAHEEVAASDVDLVIVATPPYFHPEHLEAMLNGSKHTYLEKPVATDVKGCLKVAELASKAEGKVSVDVGFQIRNGSQFAELTQRIHNGAIGDITMVDGFYFAGDLSRKGDAGMPAAERKLRNWVFYRDLGGDIIVEQNIHVIDAYNWMMKGHPVRAHAQAGRKVRTDIGDVSDHYVVTFVYPNDVRASFSSTQFLPEWGTVGWRAFGAKGFSEAFYSGGLKIVGDNPWTAADAGVAGAGAMEVDPLGDATPLKAEAFVESIVSGNYHNQLKLGADGTLSAILARQSAYEGREITWGELLASGQSYELDIDVSKLG